MEQQTEVESILKEIGILEGEEACIVDISEQQDSITVTYDTYHYLKNFLRRDWTCELVEKAFYQFTEEPDKEGLNWLDLIEDYADRHDLIEIINTHNEENILNQDIQYHIVDIKIMLEEYTFIFLQAHRGGDIRGNYSKPRVFRVADWEFFTTSRSFCECVCDNCGIRWSSYNSGYDWETVEGGLIPVPEGQLEFPGMPEREPSFKPFDTLILREDKAYCPICEAELQFYVTEDW